jgi:hypothetical protein
LEQLIGQEPTREHKEASTHILEAGAPPEALLTVANRRLSRLTVDRFLWPIFAAASE